MTEQFHRRALRSWARRYAAIRAERDPLVLAALSAGMTKLAVHQASGIARSTIDDIVTEQDEGSHDA